MKKDTKRRVAAALIALITVFSFDTGFPLRQVSIVSAAAAQELEIPALSYMSDDDYKISDPPVEYNAFGRKTLGSLYISGNINKTDELFGTTAYGIEDGDLTISYKYDGFLLDENGDYYLSEDSHKTKSGAKIRKGCVLIEKNVEGEGWKTEKTIVNYFEDNPHGNNNLYTASGINLARGTKYRITISYEIKKNKTGIDPSEHHVEIYNFFACKNNPDAISLHNLDADLSSISNGSFGEYSAEQLRMGESLKDGDTTVSGFKIDTLRSNYAITVNGNEASSGDTFTENGKYIVNVKTLLGKESQKTVYVFNGGEDKGKSVYFKNGFVQGKRIYRDGYTIPAYSRGTTAVINEIGEEIPLLTGKIVNETTEQEIIIDTTDRSPKEYPLEPGRYTANLFSGNSESGSFYHYTYRFVVLDEDAKPFLNRNRISNMSRIMDFLPKHYEVNWATGGGGFLCICFRSREDAFRYSYDIEKRFLEYEDDKIVYFRKEDEKKEPKKYESNAEKIYLTKALNENAKKHISVAYFDPTSSYTYRTFDERIPPKKTLEQMSLRKSVRVFSDEEQKKKLLCDDVPIINGYSFVQIADYDVKNISAKCEQDGKEYPIAFGKKVNDQLPVSSRYTITETNDYGFSNTYDVLYLADNETKAEITYLNNGKPESVVISKENIKNGIKSGIIRFDNISNEFDEYALMKIEPKDDLNYSAVTGYLYEFNGLVLDEKGSYDITFIDRAGQNYTLKVEILGGAESGIAGIEKGRSYQQVYDAINEFESSKEGN